MSKVTPMMQQFQAIKAEHRDSILFFRLGDFYEMFGQDAVDASKLLGITLTARNKQNKPIPMCGVPHHSAEGYIAKLTKAGRKVAICEQVSDPTLPGIVKRQVVRVITPGTTFNEQILEQKVNQYVVALFPQKDYFGLAFADLTTGECRALELQGAENLKSELLRLQPAEVVVHREHYEDPDIRTLLIQLTDAPLSTVDAYEDAAIFLRKHFKVTTLEGFGIANWPFAIQAASILIHYLKDTQKNALVHVDRITAYDRKDWMPMDEATLRNLELFSSLRGQEEKGSLLSILDHTQTSMGGRLLRRYLVQPLLKKEEILARHESVENFVNDADLRAELSNDLKQLQDLERLLGRLSATTGSARDLMGLARSLALIPRVKARLNRCQVQHLKVMETQLIPLESLVDTLEKAILEEPAIKITEGGLIRTGYHAELDSYHQLMKDAKSALKDIEASEKESTGIPSLKVKYNRVFGYYIEVSNSNLDKVPEHYTRKQTLANAERFVTPELKEYEEKVLHAEENAKALEYELFLDLRERVLDELKAIKQNAQVLAELDVLLGFATLAVQHAYVRAELSDRREMQIRQGRHPVVEQMTFEHAFVPNDVDFQQGTLELKLITGPNMSGKSTYLRQVALIALLNQMGSFVPAESARMPIFDRIFTRVGASDNLVRGQSTFMVEMQESAYILNNATDRSLIILDEVGRGTSTYDGLSLAWSILEYLHDHIGGFTLFATHYHELITLAEKLEKAENDSIDVQETPKGVLFLHKIKRGGINKSYGIEVAKLAGLPTSLVERATSILHQLEEQRELDRKSTPENQMGLFSRTYASEREPGKVSHPALDKLKDLDINNLTPIEALNALEHLKQLKPSE